LNAIWATAAEPASASLAKAVNVCVQPFAARAAVILGNLEFGLGRPPIRPGFGSNKPPHATILRSRERHARASHESKIEPSRVHNGPR
jgi:hypothetical protein